MRRVCATVSFRSAVEDGTRERIRQSLAGAASALPEIAASQAGLHFEGSVGAGQLTWDFAVADAAALGAVEVAMSSGGMAFLADRLAMPDADVAAIEAVEAWAIEGVASDVPRPEAARIKRTNFVQVRSSAPRSSVDRWLAEQPLLATHVPAIRNWSLSTVRPLPGTSPRVLWTHAWEQEFETLEGLVEDYMASPYHWGFFDAWYDPEMPQRIIEPDLAHLYCPASESALAWTAQPEGAA